MRAIWRCWPSLLNIKDNIRVTQRLRRCCPGSQIHVCETETWRAVAMLLRTGKKLQAPGLLAILAYEWTILA